MSDEQGDIKVAGVQTPPPSTPHPDSLVLQHTCTNSNAHSQAE